MLTIIAQITSENSSKSKQWANALVLFWLFLTLSLEFEAVPQDWASEVHSLSETKGHWSPAFQKHFQVCIDQNCGGSGRF